jgi:hypothetical protein
MSYFKIGNTNNPPFNNVDGNLVNKFNTNQAFFSDNTIPKGPHTVQSGGKINRHKINKISRLYKMKRSAKRRRRSRVRSKYARRYSRRHSRRYMRGGMSYPAGHAQYQNNNGSLSNTYSVGSNLSASSSALANPPPYAKVAGDPDNLNHNALNAYGNSGAGSGFASRGWF